MIPAGLESFHRRRIISSDHPTFAQGDSEIPPYAPPAAVGASLHAFSGRRKWVAMLLPLRLILSAATFRETSLLGAIRPARERLMDDTGSYQLLANFPPGEFGRK